MQKKQNIKRIKIKGRWFFVDISVHALCVILRKRMPAFFWEGKKVLDETVILGLGDRFEKTHGKLDVISL